MVPCFVRKLLAVTLVAGTASLLPGLTGCMATGADNGMGDLHVGIDQARSGVTEINAGSSEYRSGDRASSVDRMGKGCDQLAKGVSTMQTSMNEMGGSGMMGGSSMNGVDMQAMHAAMSGVSTSSTDIQTACDMMEDNDPSNDGPAIDMMDRSMTPLESSLEMMSGSMGSGCH